MNGNKKLQMGVKVKNKILLREAADLDTKVRYGSTFLHLAVVPLSPTFYHAILCVLPSLSTSAFKYLFALCCVLPLRAWQKNAVTPH